MQSKCLCFLGVGFEGVKQQGLGKTRPADSESVLPFPVQAQGRSQQYGTGVNDDLVMMSAPRNSFACSVSAGSRYRHEAKC